jgi:hypothetical protein
MPRVYYINDLFLQSVVICWLLVGPKLHNSRTVELSKETQVSSCYSYLLFFYVYSY